jgi:hypothetical protein
MSEALKSTVANDPILLKRNAIYDMSEVLVDKTVNKLNKTNSQVCQEFESFLKDEYKVDVKPIQIKKQFGGL